MNLKAIGVNKQFIFIFVIAFLVYFSSGMLSPTLPKYAQSLGSTAQVIGVFSGIFAMSALLIRPISGQAVDNENKKALLIGCIGLILLAVTGIMLSKTIVWLIVFRGLHGLAWGIGSTLCMTIASQCFTSINMGMGISLYGLGQIIAQIISPMIALTIIDWASFTMLFQLNVLVCLSALGLAFFMQIEPNTQPKKPYSINIEAMVYFPAIMPAFMTFVNSMARASILSFLVIFAHSISIFNIGLFFTIQALCIFLTRPLWGRLIDKLGLFKVLIPSQILMVTSLIMIYNAQTLAHFLWAAIFMGLATAGSQPALMAEGIRNAPTDKRGSASNTGYIGVDIGIFVGSNIAGIVVAMFGYRLLYLFFAIFVLGGTMIYMVYTYKKNQLSKNKG